MHSVKDFSSIDGSTVPGSCILANRNDSVKAFFSSVGVVTLVLLAFILVNLLLNGIDEFKYHLIEVGMTKGQVEWLLGAPSYKSDCQAISLTHGRMSSATWISPNRGIVVLFNSDGIVIGKRWDGPSLYSTPQTVGSW
jgi:hypothetical protein